MGGKRYTEERVIRFLKEPEACASVADLTCSRLGFSERGFYRGTPKFDSTACR